MCADGALVRLKQPTIALQRDLGEYGGHLQPLILTLRNLIQRKMSISGRTLGYILGGPFRGRSALRYALERAACECLLALRALDNQLRNESKR